MLVPQFESPSFTPIPTIGKIIVLYILILILVDSRAGANKILHRMTASIPCHHSTLKLFLHAVGFVRVVPVPIKPFTM
jgi:hypothetical protein